MKFSNITIPKWAVYASALTPWIAAGFLVVWILGLRFPASGVFVAQSDMTGRSAFIYPFLPAERTLSPGANEGGWTGQRIVGDPVYMNARLPGPYETVDVAMEFKTTRQPLIEFGLVKDAEGKQLDMKPWFSTMLENGSWTRKTSIKGTAGFLLSGTPTARLDDPDVRGVASWLATSTSPVMSDPEAAIQQAFKVSLRGTHDFWVVPAESKIDMTFSIQDVNRNRSGGMLAVQVTRDDEVVYQDAVGTSGSQDRGYGTMLPVKVRLQGMKDGVYRVRLISDDDVFIRQVETVNHRWVVGPRLVVGDVVGYATTTHAVTVWTTARHLVAETFHTEGLQDVTLGSAKVSVKRTHTPFRLDRADKETAPVTLSAPRGDIRFVADGFFAFSQDAFFEPQPRRLTPETDGVAEGLVMVRTDYRPTEDLGGGWRRATMSFSVPRNAEVLRFVMGASGIVSRDGAVDIRRITLIYHRPAMTWRNWWSVILSEARNAWHRL